MNLIGIIAFFSKKHDLVVFSPVDSSVMACCKVAEHMDWMKNNHIHEV